MADLTEYVASNKSKDTAIKLLHNVSRSDITDEEVQDIYTKWANTYDKVMYRWRKLSYSY